MFRVIAKPLRAVVSRRGVVAQAATAIGSQVRFSHGKKETDEEFDQRYINYFNRPDIDHWEIRKAMNELANSDLVADPKIICAALRACRKLNDYALTTRFLESMKDKCGDKVNEFWPYILQEIRPTLDELGINTPEELGYDKPELALQSIYDIH